jgi:hypothetical protein
MSDYGVDCSQLYSRYNNMGLFLLLRTSSYKISGPTIESPMPKMAYKPGSGFAVAQWVVPTPPINPEIWCQGYCNVIELFCKVAQQLLIAGHRMCSNLLEHGTITFKFRNRARCFLITMETCLLVP